MLYKEGFVSVFHGGRKEEIPLLSWPIRFPKEAGKEKERKTGKFDTAGILEGLDKTRVTRHISSQAKYSSRVSSRICIRERIFRIFSHITPEQVFPIRYL